MGLAVAGVLSAAAAVFSQSTRSPLLPGPLAATGVGSVVSDPGPQVRAGHPFTFLAAEFDSRDGAVLDGVTLEEATDGLRVVGQYVVLPSESVPVLIGYYFPPHEVRLHELPGWPVDGATAVTLALQVDAPGHYEAHGVTLAYHVGPMKYEAFWPIGVKVTVSGR
jgi:hypothetical protein